MPAEGVIREREKEMIVFKSIHDLLSCEKITYIGELLDGWSDKGLHAGMGG